MKFKAPANTGSCNIGGQQYDIVDGVLTVPDNGDFIGLLTSHGFKFISSDEKTEGDSGDGDSVPASSTAGAAVVSTEPTTKAEDPKTVTKAEAKAKVKADKAKAAAAQG